MMPRKDKSIINSNHHGFIPSMPTFLASRGPVPLPRHRSVKISSSFLQMGKQKLKGLEAGTKASLPDLPAVPLVTGGKAESWTEVFRVQIPFDYKVRAFCCEAFRSGGTCRWGD